MQSPIPSHAHVPKRLEVSERREPMAATHREDVRQFGARGVRVLRLDCLKQPLLGDAASGLDPGQLQAHAELGPGVAVRADVAAVRSPVPDSKIQLEMNLEGAYSLFAWMDTTIPIEG